MFSKHLSLNCNIWINNSKIDPGFYHWMPKNAYVINTLGQKFVFQIFLKVMTSYICCKFSLCRILFEDCSHWEVNQLPPPNHVAYQKKHKENMVQL